MFTYEYTYSQLLGTISTDQFQAALDRFGLGKFLHAEPIPFGLSKRNIFLTSTSGQYVLRGSPHHPDQFYREQFFARKLHERTCVPVPWPYLIDSTKDIFRWSYAIMPRMPGLQLADSTVKRYLPDAERRGIACALGQNLARMQDLTWLFCGEYNGETGTIQPFNVSYGQWIVARIRRNLARSREYSDRTTPADVRWVEELIADAQDALVLPFQPVFLMQDYKESNVVVEHKDERWQVSGVFDLTHAHFGDGEADLARSIAVYLDENPALAREYLQAYMNERPPRAGFARRFPIYMLDDRLQAWAFSQQIGRVEWDPQWTLREWAGRYVSIDWFQ